VSAVPVVSDVDLNVLVPDPYPALKITNLSIYKNFS
jgi:hypothetical protein